MVDQLVSRLVEDGVGAITLTDGRRRNALSHAMSDAIAEAVAWVLGRGARAIVISAEPPIFCAGGSIEDLLEPPGPLEAAYAGLHALVECPVPTIAAVGGPTIGAGVSLPLACDVVIASEASTFDPRFLDVAIHPGGGHLWLMARRVGYQGAAAMTICGDVLRGPEAVAAGLAWRCVADHDLLRVAHELAGRAASRSAPLVARTKDTLQRTSNLADRDSAEKIELAAQEWSTAQPEHLEAVRRLRERIRGKET